MGGIDLRQQYEKTWFSVLPVGFSSLLIADLCLQYFRCWVILLLSTSLWQKLHLPPEVIFVDVAFAIYLLLNHHFEYKLYHQEQCK